MSKKEMSPEDKLMDAIFGKKKVTAEVKPSADGINTQLLFIRAMKRIDELKPMVAAISKDKYFPNEHYQEVFEWSLMMAAQWQYDKLTNNE